MLMNIHFLSSEEILPYLIIYYLYHAKPFPFSSSLPSHQIHKGNEKGVSKTQSSTLNLMMGFLLKNV